MAPVGFVADQFMWDKQQEQPDCRGEADSIAPNVTPELPTTQIKLYGDVSGIPGDQSAVPWSKSGFNIDPSAFSPAFAV